MKPYQAIVALADNRLMGQQGKMPWHIPEDFRWFKAKTLGHVVVMGRKTYESIGCSLPGRKNIVLTKQPLEIEGCTVIHSLKTLASMEFAGREVFIIGGGEIYAATLPQCSDLWVSHVCGTFSGDTYFPEFETDFEAVATIWVDKAFRVVHYKRKVQRA